MKHVNLAFALGTVSLLPMTAAGEGLQLQTPNATARVDCGIGSWIKFRNHSRNEFGSEDFWVLRTLVSAQNCLGEILNQNSYGQEFRYGQCVCQSADHTRCGREIDWCGTERKSAHPYRSDIDG